MCVCVWYLGNVIAGKIGVDDGHRGVCTRKKKGHDSFPFLSAGEGAGLQQRGWRYADAGSSLGQLHDMKTMSPSSETQRVHCRAINTDGPCH